MIKIDPSDRWPAEKPRRIPGLVVIFTVAILFILCGGAYYWYAFLQNSRYSAVYQQLGITNLPSGLNLMPVVQRSLDQLEHEPCFRDAVISLADEMLRAGYPRDTGDILANFSRRCGDSDDLSLRRYSAAFMQNDFSVAARIADALVQSNPADPNIRYSRGNAYEESKDFQRALIDYINSIQLLGAPEVVSINNFYDVSRMYAALQRYCDAITPIETYISFDPTHRTTTQTTRLITEYAEKGKCASRYASGSTRISKLGFPGRQAVNVLAATINGVVGNFILDTGASYVAVTRDFAAKAKLRIDDGSQLPIKTVSGMVSADLSYASIVSVGKAEAQGVPVAVIGGTTSPFGPRTDGLLGMSFLARFKLNVSQDAIELVATPLR